MDDEDSHAAAGDFMSIKRSAFLLAWIGIAIAPIAAQEASTGRDEHLLHGAVTVVHDQKGAANARFTLWVSYPNRHTDFLDHAQYLADLQSRFGDKGIAIGVVLPEADAVHIAGTKPRMVVARADDKDQLADIVTMTCVVTEATSGAALVSLNSLDLAVDTIKGLLTDTYDHEAQVQANNVLESTWANICDGGEFDAMVKQCLTTYPHSGRAHACAVLNQWWCKGDLIAARKAIDTGLQALSNDAVPMSIFVDLVLRGDRFDPQLARKLAMAMAPVAAGASDGPFTQLVYLRALLRDGQERMAGRICATLPKRISGRADLQLHFAETLMESSNPMAHRDAAERAIQNAEANSGLRKLVYAARHKLLKRCQEDEAAEKLMKEYRARNLGSGLNNDAWYLIVQPQTMGRFDTMALAQCEEMLRVDKNIDYGSMDTVALAHFVNGLVQKAVEMQTTASKQSGNDPVYVARLKRYQATLAEIDARQSEQKLKEQGKLKK
tara:strand:+ start:117 stop:1601 length:1485 start_codon:yes stop_codon:yes gene_type:complete